MVQTGGLAENSGIRSFNDGGNLVQVSNTRVTRWYPTAHILDDGRIMMVGGDDLAGTVVDPDQARRFPSLLFPLFNFTTKSFCFLYPSSI
jgi:hypothetical protein